MEIGVIVQQMLIFVLLMATGYLVRRLGILSTEANGHLTKLLLRVTLPAAMIASISGDSLDIPRNTVPMLFFFIILSFVVMAALSWLSPWLFKAERDEHGAYIAMGLFGNANFIGIPLTAAFFGPPGMLYAILYTIVFNLTIFSLGMKLIGGKQAKLSVGLFLSPIMIAGMFSVLLFMLDIQFPYVLQRSVSLLGGVTTPVAMLLLGSILAGMKAKEMFRGWRVYIITFVRLIAAPLLVYLVFLPFSVNPLFLQVIMVMSASPMAISTVMFTVHYDRHQELVGKGIFISTLLSVITMPLLLSFLM